MLNQTLYSVNCHATTETSDLIGGLRPVRGRDAIKQRIITKLKEMIKKWPYNNLLSDLDLHKFTSTNDSDEWDLELYDTDVMVELAKTISLRRPKAVKDDEDISERSNKKRRIANSRSVIDSKIHISTNDLERIATIAAEIEQLGRQFRALFEWSDGPLVKAMKSGQYLLLDEISLAEDAVLERLNSVLEPSRLLVLAEKNDDSPSITDKDDRIIVAHNQFQLFATMNPGGDFGKRELSPALRSRFTEIWVPSIRERSDFEIILERSLKVSVPSITQQIYPQHASIVSCILDYVQWFNSDVCGASSSPYIDCILSLRDILSWAHFITEATKSNANITILDALYHGACLMHLDGLGLGSGLASDAGTHLKLKAQKFLMRLKPEESISNVSGVDNSFGIHNGKFGAFPYFVNVGKCAITESDFKMTAPTTSLNAFRVLRATQLRKPILLEGSPGVGKTSLINAIASASGNKLVRINLSEQTDISDLIGSDVPMENSANNKPSFEWCDGILLTAIKEGSWVLLDELNLASQTVLEGLNSCLDHRASIYIPELGKSFECPPSFRVFAAQNPLNQGGGRKGLPKSFLNRFTKVFIDALTDSDLRSIISTRFSSFSKDFVTQIVNFNNDIHQEVVIRQEYGTEGGPWEFNLRDVFRWCELIESGCSYIAGAHDLYYQRFRTQRDRDKMNKTFRKHFASSVVSRCPPIFKVHDDKLQIGETFLSRLHHVEGKFQTKTTMRESNLLFSRLTQMEAVARCINLRWPCLLVGGSGSGKTSIVSDLAALGNATLIEHCLSPASDVSELVGGFEQRDIMESERQIIIDVCILAKNLLISDAYQSKESKTCWDITTKLGRYLNDWNDSTFEEQIKPPWGQITKLSAILTSMVEQHITLSHFEARVKVINDTIKETILEQKSKQKQNDSGHFKWRDGILVEALLKGHWLLLENANLCPSSVLDRLNSVTEHNGFLLLSESGTQHDDNCTHTHRIIKPHENFRIFFTMNAANGEISRAMRNRCVEISLLESVTQKSLPLSHSFSSTPSHDDVPLISSIFSKVQVLDFLSITRSCRIRSMELASTILKTYANERQRSLTNFGDLPSLRSFLSSLRMFSNLLYRGIDPNESENKFIQISLEVEESTICHKLGNEAFERMQDQEGTTLPGNLSFNSVHSSNASVINTLWEGRLLQTFSGGQSNVQGVMTVLELFGAANVNEKLHQADTITPVFPSFGEMQSTLAHLFVKSNSYEELQMRVSILLGFRNPIAYIIGWMSSMLKECFTHFDNSMENSFVRDCKVLTWKHLLQQFVENEWVRNLTKKETVLDSLSNVTVLEGSYYIHESLLEGSIVPCPVTRLLYPLFITIDKWVSSILIFHDDAILMDFLPTLRLILDERDRFWSLLKDLPLNLTVTNGFFAFNENEFIVQWQWFCKAIPKHELRVPSINNGWQKVISWIDAIDRATFGGPRPTWSAKKIRKKMSIPLVPRRSGHWETYFSLKELSRDCSLITDPRFDLFEYSSKPIDLKELMDLSHPSLYITFVEKMQLLAAICTSNLLWYSNEGNETAWIDEINFPQKMKENFKTLRDSFEIEVASAKVDIEIQMVDAQIEAKLLDEVRDISATTKSKIDGYRSLKSRVLGFFGKLQLSALAEFWCVHQEIAICGQLSKILLSFDDEKKIIQALLCLKPDMSSLIDNVILRTIWEVSDMRTFQMILWAIDGKSSENQSLMHLLKSLIPTILSTLSRHSFTGSFICSNSISTSLEMPDMWNSEESHCDDNVLNDYVYDSSDYVYGNTRLRQQFRTDFMLRMFGEQLSFNREHSMKVYTIENSSHRESQSKELLSMLTNFSISTPTARLYTYHYVLFDIMTAVKETFKDCAMDTILVLAKNPQTLKVTSVDEIISAGEKVKNNFFNLFWNELLFPLFQSLHLAWNEDSFSSKHAEQCSRASVLLGLLRLNLLTPCTPMDPGMAPLAKVSLIKRQLVDIQSKLTSVRVHSAFVEGDFDPETSDTVSLMVRAENLSQKQKSQQKKVIERIKSAPAFIELFRETTNFIATVSTNTAVLEMMKSLNILKSTENGSESIKQRAKNWQRTAHAFCRRLSSDFDAYEDVTTPIVDSVGMIQDGLFALMHEVLGSTQKLESSYTDVITELHQYPMSHDSDTIKFLVEATGMGIAKSKLHDPESESRRFESLSLALLGRLCLKKELVGLRENEFWNCSRLFTAIMNSYNEFFSEEEDSSLEVMEEREFREQFPDHRREFDVTALDKLEEMDEENTTGETELQKDNCKHSGKDSSLSDTQVELLYQIYNCIFSPKEGKKINSMRKIAYHLSYAAAYELHKTFGHAGDCRRSSERMGGHVFAMCLSSIPNVAMGRVHPYFRETSNVVDFQNEACPAMALAAVKPLEKVIARITQLLTTFPGHTILIGLGKICEKVNKLNLMTTPIGKVMVGLEAILKQAQDWEQHASEKVRIGSPLSGIGELISKWRKFELESWGKLIQARQNRYTNKAKKHWVRLHAILADRSALTESTNQVTGKKILVARKTYCSVPTWVWKGSKAIGSKICGALSDVYVQDLKALATAIDTFILTSPLGEYEERLNVLKACADESSTKIIDAQSSWELQKSRTLFSIWFYYKQYLPIVTKRLNDLRDPIEKKLKEETKLAKWDNQSYYALAESTEKNQRKLMKILSEFDKALDLNAGVLIQEDNCSGLRTSVDSNDEYCSTFPSFSAIFPMQGITESTVVPISALRTCHHCDLIDVNIENISSPATGHSGKILKYVRKMKFLQEQDSGELSNSTVYVAGEVASLFCQSIFDRIEALRANGSRPMKERAFVDLLSELKQNGYSKMKFSTPKELKSIEQLFLLPSLRLDTREMANFANDFVVKGEQYYIKCVTEVNALRSETMMLGSKYMSRQDMDKMVNLSYSGIHILTQQRCLLSHLLNENHNLHEWINSVQISKQSLPPFQSELKRLSQTFQEKCTLAYESVKQLSLLIQSTKSLINGESNNIWARDIVSKLESLYCTKSIDRSNNASFITWDMLQEFEIDRKELVKAGKVIGSSREECKDLACLPLDTFDICSCKIEEALTAESKLKDVSHKPREGSTKVIPSEYFDYSTKLSSTIELVLVTYQLLNKEAHSIDQSKENTPTLLHVQTDNSAAIWERHTNFLTFCATIKLGTLNEKLFDLIEHLCNLHDDQLFSNDQLQYCVGLLSNTRTLVVYLHRLYESLLQDYIYFYFSTAKLNYIISRVFRSLVAKGYCADKTTEGDGEGEGDIKGMTFEDDQEGTGMGDGDGKKDVTDQIENEDELAGLKSDKNNDDDQNKNDESKQLNEEEADQGMEMEADFDGEMYDLPEKPEDQTEVDDDDKEEDIEREMDDSANPDEQVVDEKMWNDSDDENELEKEEEKFEQDSGVEGQALEDGLRTKEDETEGEKPDGNDDPSHENSQEENPEPASNEFEDQDDEQMINEDNEDRYEEQHDVDVRGDENEETKEEPNELDDQMDLGDNLQLDEEDHEGDSDGPAVEGAAENESDNDENEPNPDSKDDDGDNDNTNDENSSCGESLDADDDGNDETDTYQAANTIDLDSDEKDNPDNEEDDDMKEDATLDKPSENTGATEAHGIRSNDGNDAVEDDDDDEENQDGDQNDQNDGIGNASSGNDQAEIDADDGGGHNDGMNDESHNAANSKENSREVPNPLKNPGDASKFWHRKLNIIDSQDSTNESNTEENQKEDIDPSQNEKSGGEFEHCADNNSTQVLDEVANEDAVELDLLNNNTENKEEQPGKNSDRSENEMSEQIKTDRSRTKQKNPISLANQRDEKDVDETSIDDASMTDEIDGVFEEEIYNKNKEMEEEEDFYKGNQVVSDISKLSVEENNFSKPGTDSGLILDEYTTIITTNEAEEARIQWLDIQGKTQSLSRRLCEKLRLVMEPLVASKLRGDYRTGKRINMKRVIGYIASGYRKDKIWLRRTKPAKRNYRVLLAVDDSESMKKSGAGEMALHAMATVAVGMNQLEIGELGVASFGDDMKLIHPFHIPFTAESGIDVVRNFRFEQQRTRIATCVESAMTALEDSGDRSSMQLAFLISDGRIERDSKPALKRLIREAVERNILLAMIIVEGNQRKNESIVNMKEVTFEKGKAVFKRFIDDYPFPYYIILEDVASLPEVLGDALKQWFELITQMQSS